MMDIKTYLPLTELLCQLAEESNELSQAALKLRRALDGRNPTPTTIEDCMNNLIEEAADVLLCLYVCGFDTDEAEGVQMNQVAMKKFKRWIQRLEAMK